MEQDRRIDQSKDNLYTAGHGEKHTDWKSPEYAQEIFEKQWAQCLRQERTVNTQEGSMRTLCVYEVQVDARDKILRNDGITRFGLDAVQAGHTPVLSPVVIPSTFESPTQSLNSVYFFFEKPAAKQPSETSAQPTSDDEPQNRIGFKNWRTRR